MPDALQVFLTPPSWAELVRRLTGRGTEPPDVIARRLAVAREELAAEAEFDDHARQLFGTRGCRAVGNLDGFHPGRS